MDLAILVDSWAPWYPPGNAPKNADIVSISENPLKINMVYQTMEASHYLEGNIAATLRLLTEALRHLGLDEDAVANRRARCVKEHDKWHKNVADAEAGSTTRDHISIPLLMKTLRDVMPASTSYVDETITHYGDIRNHIKWDDPNGYFRAPSGLGQGMGYALGVKLALPQQHVVLMIGDGSFLYNPAIAALTTADEYELPLLTVICNNRKYAIMEQLHDRFYPDGIAGVQNDYSGVHIHDSGYEHAAQIVGGYSAKVETPGQLKPALEAALACINSGKSAIVNVILPEFGSQRSS